MNDLSQAIEQMNEKSRELDYSLTKAIEQLNHILAEIESIKLANGQRWEYGDNDPSDPFNQDLEEIYGA